MDAAIRRRSEDTTKNDPLVEAVGLTKRYGPRSVAAEGLNPTVRRGEVYGFLGPNGAGKTTTFGAVIRQSVCRGWTASRR